MPVVVVLSFDLAAHVQGGLFLDVFEKVRLYDRKLVSASGIQCDH